MMQHQKSKYVNGNRTNKERTVRYCFFKHIGASRLEARMLAGWKDSTAIEFLSGKESDHLGKDLYIFSLSVSKTELKNEKRR